MILYYFVTYNYITDAMEKQWITLLYYMYRININNKFLFHYESITFSICSFFHQRN